MGQTCKRARCSELSESPFEKGGLPQAFGPMEARAGYSLCPATLFKRALRSAPMSGMSGRMGVRGTAPRLGCHALSLPDGWTVGP